MGIKKVVVRQVSKTYQNKTNTVHVLNSISMEVGNNEFVSIVGPSGCGKSTVFRLLTGLDHDFQGEIMIDEDPIHSYSKPIGYMHQKDLLLPWRTVLQNVVLPLEIKGMDKEEAMNKVRDMLPIFGLQGFEHVYPNHLSGGMRQRAALLRTFMMDSDILLLDEPFGALDAMTKQNLQSWLLSIWEKYSHTVIFITHDIDEAIFLSDKVYVMSHRPGTMKLELKINLERPRNKDVLTSSQFMAYKRELMQALYSSS